MNRKEITAFLRDLLKKEKFSGSGKYWASEVSIDYGSKNVKRVDFMQFVPPNQCSVSAIEKGAFYCYEVKSCKADVYSGNGLNLLGEKNYIVTTMQCYKELIPDINSGKFLKHLRECNPESSNHYGIMVAVPRGIEKFDEFEDPTPINEEAMKRSWELKTIKNCIPGSRKRSITELLFCMLRSGR